MSAAMRPLDLRLLVQVGDLEAVEVAHVHAPVRLEPRGTSEAAVVLPDRVMHRFMRAVERAARRIGRIRP